MYFQSISCLLALSTLSLGAPVSSLADAPWDIIVVGAGPAGIIVADRMSEAGKKTLLLEEGGASYGITGGTERPNWLSGTSLSRVDVPGLYSTIFSVSSSLLCNKWTNTFGGCTLGGSSAINAGLFFQPPASDWDKNNPAGWKNSDVSVDSTHQCYNFADNRSSPALRQRSTNVKLLSPRAPRMVFNTLTRIIRQPRHG